MRQTVGQKISEYCHNLIQYSKIVAVRLFYSSFYGYNHEIFIRVHAEEIAEVQFMCLIKAKEM